MVGPDMDIAGIFEVDLTDAPLTELPLASLTEMVIVSFPFTGGDGAKVIDILRSPDEAAGIVAVCDDDN